MAFLGEQPDPAPFAESLRAAAAAAPGARLQLAGGLCFDGRVMAAGLTGDLAALAQLAGRVQQACRDARAEIEDRPYRPHLTLERGRQLDVPLALAGFTGQPWPVHQIELVRSRLGQRAEHEVLQAFPVGTADQAPA